MLLLPWQHCRKKRHWTLRLLAASHLVDDHASEQAKHRQKHPKAHDLSTLE
jgi:hypothetical protein